MLCVQFTLVTAVACHTSSQARTPHQVTSLVKRPSELPEDWSLGTRQGSLGGSRAMALRLQIKTFQDKSQLRGWENQVQELSHPKSLRGKWAEPRRGKHQRPGTYTTSQIRGFWHKLGGAYSPREFKFMGQEFSKRKPNPPATLSGTALPQDRAGSASPAPLPGMCQKQGRTHFVSTREPVTGDQCARASPEGVQSPPVWSAMLTSRETWRSAEKKTFEMAEQPSRCARGSPPQGPFTHSRTAHSRKCVAKDDSWLQAP